MMRWPLVLIAVAFLLVVVACGDDDASPSPSPPATESGSPRPEQIFRTESREALGAYLTSEGLDGMTGELTDPLECSALPEDGAEGEFCLIEPSTYAPALALIFVADVDNQDENIWQVRVVNDEGEWQVTETTRLPAE